MTNDFVASPGGRRAARAHQTQNDDASDATPSNRRVPQLKSAMLIERTVKFRFMPAGDGEPVPPYLVHLHWIQAVQENFGQSVQIYNNNGCVMPKVDTMRWTAAQHGQI